MFIEVNKSRLNTVSFGKGRRTFLTHGGWVANWEVWQQPFELMSKSWRCVSYDHRGAGESPVPPETITPEALVDDLFAVMDALEVEHCVLGGESSGGFIALMAALRQPDRFEGLVLVDATSAITVETAKPLVDGSRTDYPATVKAFVDACVPEPIVSTSDAGGGTSFFGPIQRQRLACLRLPTSGSSTSPSPI